MSMISFNDFKRVGNTRKFKKITLSSFNKDVCIYELTRKDIKKFSDVDTKNVGKLRKDDSDTLNDMISKILCDENGERIIPDGSEKIVDDFPVSLIKEIMDAFNEISGVNTEIEEAEKN